MKRILVVEDDVMLKSGVSYNLELDNYRAVPVYNAASAIESIRVENFNLIVLE